MTPEQKDLARRFVECEHWRWMPGMRCTHRWTGGIRVLVEENGQQSESYVVLPDADGNAVMTIDECGIMGGFPNADSSYPFLPDLTDTATLGCILALVRQCFAYAVIWTSRDCTVDALDPDSFCMDETEGWTVCIGTVDDYVGELGRGATEAEALLSALEIASTLEAA
jgi:hypothetical protein